MTDPWLSAGVTAAHLDVTKVSFYTWMAEKHAPALKIDRRRKFRANEVDAWVRSDDAAASEEDV